MDIRILKGVVRLKGKEYIAPSEVKQVGKEEAQRLIDLGYAEELEKASVKKDNDPPKEPKNPEGDGNSGADGNPGVDENSDTDENSDADGKPDAEETKKTPSNKSKKTTDGDEK